MDHIDNWAKIDLPATTALYASWFFWKMRFHHFADVMDRHGSRVRIHTPRSLRSTGPPVPPGARLAGPIGLPDRLKRLPLFGEAVRRHNAGLTERAVLRFVSDPADLHVYASVPQMPLPHKPRRLIYDCLDDWAAFDGAAPDVVECERDLCRRADRIWVVSRFLQDKLAEFADKVLYVPNGVEYDHFAVAPSLRPQAAHNRRRLGYIGLMAAWFDASLVGHCARMLSDWDIVLVGPDKLTPEQHASLDGANVHFLGLQNYADLPGILAGIDVCMIPFVINDLIKGTSPIKLYEYLAAGCPVVATRMPEVEPFVEQGVVAVADDPAGFAEAVRSMAGSPGRTGRRQEIARLNSWTARFLEALNERPIASHSGE